MKIVYKESFSIRLENQIKFIKQDNPTAAQRFKKELIAKIKTIPSNPIQEFSENQFISITIQFGF